MTEKALSEYTGITPEIVKRYIQLDRTDAMQAFAESHPFFKERTPKLDRIRELLRGLDPEARRELLRKLNE